MKFFIQLAVFLIASLSIMGQPLPGTTWNGTLVSNQGEKVADLKLTFENKTVGTVTTLTGTGSIDGGGAVELTRLSATATSISFSLKMGTATADFNGDRRGGMMLRATGVPKFEKASGKFTKQ